MVVRKTAVGSPDATAVPSEIKKIVLQRVGRKTAKIEIKGITPLIVHRWDEKAKRIMLESFQGKKATKTPKNPEAEFKASLYTLGRGYGFPAVAFKAATVAGGRFFNGVTMTELMQSMFITGEGPEDLIKINGSPVMREDVVRLNGTKTDIRYRGMFQEWSAILNVVYVADMFDVDTIVSLVDAGGIGGVGEWRPSKSKTGSFGTYEVVGADA